MSVVMKVSNLNSTDKSQKINLSFDIGEKFLGKIVSVDELKNEAVIKMLDGWQFIAQIQDGTKSLSDELTRFEVSGFKDGKIILSVIDSSNSVQQSEDILKKLFENLNLNINKDDMNLFSDMIKHDIPLTKDNVSDVKTLIDLKNKIVQGKGEDFIQKYLDNKGIELNSEQGQLEKSELTKFFTEFGKLNSDDVLTMLENKIDFTLDNIKSFMKVSSEPMSVYNDIKQMYSEINKGSSDMTDSETMQNKLQNNDENVKTFHISDDMDSGEIRENYKGTSSNNQINNNTKSSANIEQSQQNNTKNVPSIENSNISEDNLLKMLDNINLDSVKNLLYENDNTAVNINNIQKQDNADNVNEENKNQSTSIKNGNNNDNNKENVNQTDDKITKNNSNTNNMKNVNNDRPLKGNDILDDIIEASSGKDKFVKSDKNSDAQKSIVDEADKTKTQLKSKIMNDDINSIKKETILSEAVKSKINDKISEMKNMIKDVMTKALDLKSEDYSNIFAFNKGNINDFKVFNSISNQYYYMDVPIEFNNNNYEFKLLVKDDRAKGKKIDSKNVKMVISVKTENIGIVDAYINVLDKNMKIDLKCDENWTKVLDKNKSNLEKALYSLQYNVSVNIYQKKADANIITCRDFFNDNNISHINIKV